MEDAKIKKLSTLNASYLEQMLTLLVDSFYFMFKGISKDREVLRKLFAPCIQQDFVYVLLDNDLIVGFIAVSNFEKRAIMVERNICVSIFGKTKGNLLTWQLRKILSTPAVRDCESGYIDFLATAPNFRRKGAAARLLAFAEENMGFSDLSLDVLASNMPAICLYKKLGYQTETVKNNIIMRLAGIKKMYIMKKACGITL